MNCCIRLFYFTVGGTYRVHHSSSVAITVWAEVSMCFIYTGLFLTCSAGDLAPVSVRGSVSVFKTRSLGKSAELTFTRNCFSQELTDLWNPVPLFVSYSDKEKLLSNAQRFIFTAVNVTGHYFRGKRNNKKIKLNSQ